ncbi:hypothetical protein D9M69_536330 [compost metagenome]
MFLAQVAHESDGFKAMVENLNYSADGLANTWPSRYAEKGADGQYVKVMVGGRPRNKPNAKAQALHRQPESIANDTYASRMGNGPVASGDGWRFRGRGLIQLTGRDLYTACGRGIGLDLAQQPHLLERPHWAALSAGWYWSQRGLNAPADAGNVLSATKIINGGENGLDDRRARFDRAKKALASAGGNG